MAYQDQMLTCETCGKSFVYRVEEQRHQEELGFEPEIPTVCPDCRSTVTIEPGLHEGVIKWYRDDKHFGFIVQRNGGEVFFHRTNYLGDDPAAQLQEGTAVWYELQDSDRGPMAVNVHLME